MPCTLEALTVIKNVLSLISYTTAEQRCQGRCGRIHAIHPAAWTCRCCRLIPGRPDSSQVTLTSFLQIEATTSIPGAQIWADLVGQREVKVQKAAAVILWLAMPGNEVANVHSTTFAMLHAHPQFGNILCGALLPSRRVFVVANFEPLLE